MKASRSFRTIQVARLIIVYAAFLIIKVKGGETTKNQSPIFFRVGSVEMALPSSWEDQLRGQYSGRILSNFCFHNKEKKDAGKTIEIFTWQQLWKSKESFTQDYLRVENIAKNNPQFLAKKNFKVGLIEGNYLIEIADSKNNKANTSVAFYINNNNFSGSIIYHTKTKDGMAALVEFKELINKQSSVK